ncbi:MAG: hypothetical protein P1V20_04365 [Verrucomicrobiales bacterium]|nr:hypothetical protein [Verrucomicrobiales bacterium]
MENGENLRSETASCSGIVSNLVSNIAVRITDPNFKPLAEAKTDKEVRALVQEYRRHDLHTQQPQKQHNGRQDEGKAQDDSGTVEHTEKILWVQYKDHP